MHKDIIILLICAFVWIAGGVFLHHFQIARKSYSEHDALIPMIWPILLFVVGPLYFACKVIFWPFAALGERLGRNS